MAKKKISVIIPVFNGEKYIDTICKQLDNQTFKNFEVIFIDDCSTDNSYPLLLEKTKKYKYIKVLRNNKNSGAGVSRNYGIKKASYEYIGFLDCDDKIPSNYFEELTKVLFKENADIVLCDIKITYEEGFEELPDSYISVCHNIPVSKQDIIHNDFVAGAWNKIIKKEILEQNLFAEGIISEDIPSIIGSILDAKKIAYTNKTFYTYVQRKNSVQNGSNLLKRFDVFKAVEELIEKKNGQKELRKNLDAIIYHQIILFLFYGIINNRNLKHRNKYLKLFEQKARRYQISKNKYYLEFLGIQSKKNQLFYKTILRLMDIKMFKITDIFITLSQFFNDKSKNWQRKVIKQEITIEDLIKAAKKNRNQDFDFTISVIIPNYNYKNFLMQRIYSILIQTYKINEIIFLDDYSTDNSVDLINSIVDNLKKIIKCKVKYNTKNSGSPYKQWEKGFTLAESEYIWIAEADDYSHKNFLKEVIAPMKKNKNIVLSYCDTSYINKEGIILTKTVKNLIDIMNTGHWDKDYINDGIDEIKNYEFLNCTIANVSSTIVKNDNYKKEFAEANKYKQCGDWYFYYSLMQKGKVAYLAQAFNYSRLHGLNSTTNLKKKIHYEEIKRMQDLITREYKIKKDNKKFIEKRRKDLLEIWNLSDINFK